MPHFRRWRLHELATDRRIEKQMPHFDRRADIHRTRFNRLAIGSLSPQLVAAVARGHAAPEGHVADLGDRGQRFASEPERPHIEKILRVGKLARRMGSQCQFQLLGLYATPIVADSKQIDAAA